MSILHGMSEDSRLQYKFMIPADLKSALEEAARLSSRSLSSEIILRLEQSMMEREQVYDDPLRDRLDQLQHQKSVALAELGERHARLDYLQREIARTEEALANRPKDAAEDEKPRFGIGSLINRMHGQKKPGTPSPEALERLRAAVERSPLPQTPSHSVAAARAAVKRSDK